MSEISEMQTGAETPSTDELVGRVETAPGNLGSITLVPQPPEGWDAGVECRLPDAGETRHVPGAPFPTREQATIVACEEIISWCSVQKEAGSKRHRQKAEQLQNWALDQEKRAKDAEQIALAGPTRIMTVEECRAVESIAELSDTGTQDDAIPPLVVDAIRDMVQPDPVLPAGGGELRMTPLDKLVESPLNPRQYYPEGPMAELTESMRANGFRSWLPIVVRPLPDGFFEIAAGHRRARAARAAGIALAPCMVRQMSDEEFLDILNFDNSGRLDVHPLHEAAGWRVWMEKTGKGVLDIAKRIGKGVSKEYVYQRLQYSRLIEPVREAFLENKIKAGHATDIARLDHDGQLKALEFCTPAVFEPDNIPSVRQLRAWIRRNLHCSLENAAFSLDDALLVPAAGACTLCPHRLGNAPDFDPTEDLPNVCTRPECFSVKEAAFQERREQIFREQHPEPEPAPPRAAKPKRAKVSKEQQQAEADRIRKEAEALDLQRQREEQERQEREKKLEAEKQTRTEILRTILERVKWPPRREEIAELLCEIAGDFPDTLDEILSGIGVEPSMMASEIAADVRKLPEQKLAQMVLVICVAGDFDEWRFSHGMEKLTAAAKRYGVDPLKIRAKAEGGTRKEVVQKLPALGQAAKPKVKKKPAPAPKPAVKKPAPAARKAKGGKKGGKK